MCGTAKKLEEEGDKIGGSISNPWEFIQDTTSKISNKFNNEATNLSTGIDRDVQALGKNAEMNLQDHVAGQAALWGGKWDNLDRTLMDPSSFTWWANRDDKNNALGKETLGERMEAEGVKQAKLEVVQAAKAEQDNLNNQISTMLKGVTEGQKRSPGRSQTLLGNGGASGTLLTARS